MEYVLKWALAFVDKIPPIPASNLLAFIIIALLIAGLVRKAIRSPSPVPVPEPIPVVTLNASSVYTVLVNIELELAKVSKRVQLLGDEIDVIGTMMRRRHKPVRNRRGDGAKSDGRG